MACIAAEDVARMFDLLGDSGYVLVKRDEVASLISQAKRTRRRVERYRRERDEARGDAAQARAERDVAREWIDRNPPIR